MHKTNAILSVSGWSARQTKKKKEGKNKNKIKQVKSCARLPCCGRCIGVQYFSLENDLYDRVYALACITATVAVLHNIERFPR